MTVGPTYFAHFLFLQAYLEFFANPAFVEQMQEVLRNYPYVNYHIINRKVISLFLCVHREGESEGEGERQREGERERDPAFIGCCKLHALTISLCLFSEVRSC